MDVFPYLKAVRDKGPLVHHITNWVTIYDCAQIVKSFGASPVMAHAPEEAADMTGIASALVLNIGTLTTGVVDAMKLAGRRAAEQGIPVVLDACGAGATPFRDRACRELLEAFPIAILKGNASEIARLAGLEVRSKGVDTAAVEGDLEMIARDLASRRGCTVVITGARDLVTDGERLLAVANGVPLMAQVVGTGCMAASVIGTFAAASPEDVVQAAAAGLCCYEIAAEIVVNGALGPASFKNALFDAVPALTEAQVASMGKVEPCAASTSSPTTR